MTRLLLIRHAMTDTAGKSLAGRAPGIFLNETGKAQAIRLAERLKGIKVDAIYCSPLERAVETAGQLIKLYNLPCNISRDFIEIDFGKWTNLTIEELKKNAHFHLFNYFRSSTRIPGGELMIEAQARIVRGIQNIQSLHKDKTIVIISHADVIRAAIAHFAGIHLDMLHRLEISLASVSIIDLYDDTAILKLLNATGTIDI